MNNQILQLLLKLYRTKDVLSTFEMSALSYYNWNTTGQESDYYQKILDAFYNAAN